MKKNSGFTLIELLAVIVILAIIALIATPVVLNIIDKTRGSARVASANGVLDSAENFYMASLLDTEMVYPIEGLEFICNGISCTATVGTVVEEDGVAMLSESEPTSYSLIFRGTIPTSGSITIESDGIITPTNLAIDSHICTYDEKTRLFIECK